MCLQVSDKFMRVGPSGFVARLFQHDHYSMIQFIVSHIEKAVYEHYFSFSSSLRKILRVLLPSLSVNSASTILIPAGCSTAVMWWW